MYNLTIEFLYPILLLLLIPALLLTLIPHFRLAKRYRRTRNRITALVLRILVMTMAILTLSGMRFLYQIPNEENEIILLVDVSDSKTEVVEERDELVETILDYSKYDGFKVGIVTFGYDQEYAVPLTSEVNVKEMYEQYLLADTPDTSATNIAAALNYARGLFNNPQTGKIVLITDGKETDEKATTAIKAVAAYGIKVDTAYISAEPTQMDAQLIDVILPEIHITAGDPCTINVMVQSKAKLHATIAMYDNGELNAEAGTKKVELEKGEKVVSFDYKFTSNGLHELTFEMTIEDDNEKNNTYSSYIYLENYNHILILESEDDTSLKIEQLLNAEKDEEGNDPYVIERLNIYEHEKVPKTVEELRKYDQVILNNIANKDMPQGFDAILEEYVSVYGGGLLTAGGDDEAGDPHAYNRQDMYNTLYQRMLPVQAINYTPPVGVMIVIDRSGSMTSEDDSGNTKLDWALAGARACLDALTERDYLGVMTLDSELEVILGMTACTQRRTIETALLRIDKATGGTELPEAIERAGQILTSDKRFEKRHIIIVTDAMVPESQKEFYNPHIIRNYENGITMSIVGIGLSKADKEYQQMLEAVELGHGRLHNGTGGDLVRDMREDLNVPEIKEFEKKTFNPIIANENSLLVDDLTLLEGSKDKLAIQLDGFYGVKARSAADVILVGEYDVPIYAQWKYGKGMVGSFMSDFNEKWSSPFMNSPDGQTFIRRAVENLMPTEDIAVKGITLRLREDNYGNQLSVYTQLNEGEYVTGKITDMDGNVAVSLTEVATQDAKELRTLPFYVTLALTEANHYSRCNIVVRESGTYRIILNKHDAEGNILETVETFKTLAYSQEYNMNAESEELTPIELVEKLAEDGNGAVIADLEDPVEVFANFITRIDRIFDPRFLFMILTLIMFLLEVAVRKFKFKWPHELIREYRDKKQEK